MLKVHGLKIIDPPGPHPPDNLQGRQGPGGGLTQMERDAVFRCRVRSPRGAQWQSLSPFPPVPSLLCVALGPQQRPCPHCHHPRQGPSLQAAGAGLKSAPSQFWLHLSPAADGRQVLSLRLSPPADEGQRDAAWGLAWKSREGCPWVPTRCPAGPFRPWPRDLPFPDQVRLGQASCQAAVLCPEPGLSQGSIDAPMNPLKLHQCPCSAPAAPHRPLPCLPLCLLKGR